MGGFRYVVNAAAVFVAMTAGLWVWRKIKVRELTEVPFEADMPADQMFQGFNLSEIQAAQAVASHANGETARRV